MKQQFFTVIVVLINANTTTKIMLHFGVFVKDIELCYGLGL